MVIPAGFKTFHEALRCGSEVHHALKARLEAKYGKSAINVGDEGGFAPDIESVEEALGQISDAVEEAGYSPGQNVVLGLDAAADSFYNEDKKTYLVDGKQIGSKDLFELYAGLERSFHVKSIEDQYHDEDFDTLEKITKNIYSRLYIIIEA